jgi:ABC-type branched-subunit amino acid transport system ATPase component
LKIGINVPLTGFAAAGHVSVLESGRTVWNGNAADARNDPDLAAAYLGLR